MNIYRSALSACVIVGLPNVYDFIHKHRERLMEEKRQKLLALEDQRRQHDNAGHAGNAGNNNNPIAVAEVVQAAAVNNANDAVDEPDGGNQ